jgi:hypothetical protein
MRVLDGSGLCHTVPQRSPKGWLHAFQVVGTLDSVWTRHLHAAAAAVLVGTFLAAFCGRLSPSG